MFRSIISAMAVLIAGAALIMTCGQSDPAHNQSGEYSHLDLRGDCLGDDIAVQDSGYLETAIFGNDLHIYHRHAYYNCCLDYKVNYSVQDNIIEAVEFDTGQPCRCDCYFDLASTLYDLQSGGYIVRLIGLSGALVGADTIFVP